MQYVQVVRRIVSPLHLFDVLVQELKVLNHLWRHLSVIAEVVVDKFLEQPGLHLIVCYQAVDKPRQQ